MLMIKSFFHKVTIVFNAFKIIILDALFPIKCLGCGKFDEWICDDCHSTLPILSEQHCPECKKHITKNGELCPECLQANNGFVDGVFVASYYNDKLLKQAIHYYKYRFVYSMSKPLALLLAQSLQHSTVETPDMIIPVPLHKRRLRWRGFNQATLLAKDLDLQININTDILLRVKYTSPQVKMKHKTNRQENLTNAFTISNSTEIIDKTILLVDDIVTTGSTLSECAKVLKENGAKKVFCLVLARG